MRQQVFIVTDQDFKPIIAFGSKQAANEYIDSFIDDEFYEDVTEFNVLTMNIFGNMYDFDNRNTM